MFRIESPPPSPPHKPIILPDADPVEAAEFDSDCNEMHSMLFDPLYAFAASWHYSRKLMFGVQKRSAPDSNRYDCRFCSAPKSSAVRSLKLWELHFGTALNALCAIPDLRLGTLLSGEPKDGLKAFWMTIGTLLNSWLPLRAEPNRDLAWSDFYPDLVAAMNRAQMARVTWLKRPNFFEVEDGKNPGLITQYRLREQMTFSQAGRTAAYGLWGEFLANGSSGIDFCETCAHPFPFRSNQRFYPASCGTKVSSLKAHRREVRTDNWKDLRKSAKKLRSRIASGRRRNLLEGIKSGRWRTRFVRAASLPPDSPEFQVQRDKLLDLCLGEGSTENHRAQVEKTLDQFLKDIAESRPYIPNDR